MDVFMGAVPAHVYNTPSNYLTSLDLDFIMVHTEVTAGRTPAEPEEAAMPGDRDPYQALGLGADASTADISRAYRRLARALHPDSQPGDAAAEQFRAVSDAYQLLSDPARRSDWDRRHPHPARGPQRPPGHTALPQRPAEPQIWPLSPHTANPPHPSGGPRPALWAGPVHVEPAPGAGGTGLARREPDYGDLAWILERLLADRWDLGW
jgi:curved DNA-binding protein CbpA